MAPRSGLRARRRQLGVSQKAVAIKVGVHKDTYRAWEAGTSDPRLYQHRELATVLDVELDDLDDLLLRDDERSTRAAHDDNVNRREFLARTAAFAVGPRLRHDAPRSIGAEHLDAVQETMRRVERQDAAAGGGRLLDEVASLRWQVEQWLERSTFPARLGHELQAHVGELSAWAGWLAFDMDEMDVAGFYLHDALTQARLNDNPQLEVRALSYISLLTGFQKRPRTALQAADAGLRLLAGWGTPRLSALMHIRAARACAALGESAAFSSSMAKAARCLDHGPHPDDPLYIDFVSPQELNGMAGVSYLDLGRPDRAAHAFRDALGHCDPSRPRNAAYYTARLALAITEQGDMAEGAAIGLELLPQVATLTSGRTRRRLAELHAAIEPQAQRPTARDFVDAYAATFAR